MNIDFMSDISGSLEIFLTQSFYFFIKLLIAYIIWLIGKVLIDYGIRLLRKADIKSLKVDDSIRNTIINIGRPTAKVVLVLAILDYLGVGTSIIGAMAQGISFSIAIAVGISFGEALKDDAKRIVQTVKKKTDFQ